MVYYRLHLNVEPHLATKFKKALSLREKTMVEVFVEVMKNFIKETEQKYGEIKERK
jgi:hypothetical protein